MKSDQIDWMPRLVLVFAVHAGDCIFMQWPVYFFFSFCDSQPLLSFLIFYISLAPISRGKILKICWADRYALCPTVFEPYHQKTCFLAHLCTHGLS